MARLRVVKGNDEGKIFELPAYEWVIGRGVDCDLVIDDPRASRRHACIRLTRGTWMVRDLGSSGGTFVNKAQKGRSDEWSKIRHGDRVRVGHTLLLFEDETAPSPAPASAGPKPLPDQVEIPGHRVGLDDG